LFKCPSMTHIVGSYSWPDLGDKNAYFYMGFENGGVSGTGITVFTVGKVGNTDKVVITVGNLSYYWSSLYITDWVGISTANGYAVYMKVFDKFTMINAGPQSNATPVAFVIPDAYNAYWAINGPPYAIIAYPGHISRYTGVMHAIEGSYTGELSVPSFPLLYRVNSDSCSGSISLPLYLWQTKTKVAGTQLNGGVYIHAFPVRGLVKGVVYFMSDTGGSLTFEVIDSSYVWRTYDVVNFSGNNLVKYVLRDVDGIAMRMIYQPSSTPSTPSVAEVHLTF